MSDPIVLSVGDISLEFPLEIWVLIAVAIVYAILLPVVLLRRFCLRCRRDLYNAQHRFTEIVTIWALMLVHSTVYVTALLAIYNLVIVPFDASCLPPGATELVTGGKIGAIVGVSTFTGLSLMYGATIDVLGRHEHKPCCDHVAMILSALGLYQIAVVWKISGHKETNDGKDSCCVFFIDNVFGPKVKDAKDLVSLQAVLQSIPVVIVLLGSYVLLPCGEWSISVIISLATAAISVMIGIMIVDWDAGHADYGLSGLKFLIYLLLSFVKRLVELAGSVMFFTYFLMIQGPFVLLLLIVMFILMMMTQLNLAESSQYSRFASMTNRVYLAWGAIFFGFFKRVSADQEFNGKVTTMMPAAFELSRYIMKFAVFVIAYFVSFASGNHPELDTQDNLAAAILTWGSLVCYSLLLVITLVEFICFRRKSVKCADCALWKNWCLYETWCRFICQPQVVVVNTDVTSTPLY